MRRARIVTCCCLAAAALLPAGADPHPGHPQPMVSVANFAFTPQTITAYTGDTVLWTWNGPDTNHSVTSDAVSGRQFDSDPGKPAVQILHPSGYGFSVTFDKAGTYTYHCKVHSTMTATVVVKQTPSTIPAAPTLSGVSAKVSGNAARVRFTVSQRADVQLLVTKRASTQPLREVDATVPAGTATRTVRFGKLRPGPYDIRTIAVNPVTGLSSKTIVIHVRHR
jgi:plastocyanin